MLNAIMEGALMIFAVATLPRFSFLLFFQKMCSRPAIVKASTDPFLTHLGQQLDQSLRTARHVFDAAMLGLLPASFLRSHRGLNGKRR
jgi:hypothetical protein